MAEKKRRARGEGSIRQRKDGTWEARFVTGIDPGTGKEIRKSVYAKTQKEVRKKMTEAISSLDAGTYKEPSKMTVGEWLDIWTAGYLGDVRPRTVESYHCQIRNHIRPALGATKLEALNAHTIQMFYNRLSEEGEDKPGLSPKTVKIIHGVLHKALGQAVINGYIRSNPSDACTLPRKVRKEIKPLDEEDIGRFVEALAGEEFELLYLVTLFTGMRQGEILGLTWDCVDFKAGTVTVNKQLQKTTGGGSTYNLVPTKSDRGRTITPAAFVMDKLRLQQKQQSSWQAAAGALWDNQYNLVFTDKLGGHLVHRTVFRHFKKIVASLDLPDMRFHDLRHSYAVAAIRSGDDIKTVQSNLGHSDATTTLNIYAHVTDQMNRASAERMQGFIKNTVKNA